MEIRAVIVWWWDGPRPGPKLPQCGRRRDRRRARAVGKRKIVPSGENPEAGPTGVQTARGHGSANSPDRGGGSTPEWRGRGGSFVGGPPGSSEPGGVEGSSVQNDATLKYAKQHRRSATGAVAPADVGEPGLPQRDSERETEENDQGTTTDVRPGRPHGARRAASGKDFRECAHRPRRTDRRSRRWSLPPGPSGAASRPAVCRRARRA